MSLLTESDRLKIEHNLRWRISFQRITQKLNKSRSTIHREFMTHLQACSKEANVGALRNAAFIIEIAML